MAYQAQLLEMGHQLLLEEFFLISDLNLNLRWRPGIGPCHGPFQWWGGTVPLRRREVVPPTHQGEPQGALCASV